MVGVNMASFYEGADRYRNAFLSIVPIALFLFAGGGWVIAQRALKPVALITGTAAERITARALNQRVPLIGSDRELSRLTRFQTAGSQGPVPLLDSDQHAKDPKHGFLARIQIRGKPMYRDRLTLGTAVVLIVLLCHAAASMGSP